MFYDFIPFSFLFELILFISFFSLNLTLMVTRDILYKTTESQFFLNKYILISLILSAHSIKFMYAIIVHVKLHFCFDKPFLPVSYI